jgi:hypothetical protein
MIVNCVPRANVDMDELVASSHTSMALYNKMIARIDLWLSRIDDESVTAADVVKAYAMLAPVLESLVVIRGKIAGQRAEEAVDVTRQMKTHLERNPPRIAETLRLMRDRFSEIRKVAQ